LIRLRLTWLRLTRLRLTRLRPTRLRLTQLRLTQLRLTRLRLTWLRRRPPPTHCRGKVCQRGMLSRLRERASPRARHASYARSTGDGSRDRVTAPGGVPHGVEPTDQYAVAVVTVSIADL